ncbi:EAL domain-containing protein [Crenobacter intestini]|uniref:EAL domain-containing protein n=1 Tax=Crenobacter intestini TaxID=2563443 RepID=A0A4T0V3Z4_9NEIS|nr:EAL domain-containing protein [Crenobacter intestini]TIC86057.1 EAL domain-containing protein [Crenobacter intestini]
MIIVLGVCIYAPFFTAFELRGLGTSRVLAALPGFERADDGAGPTDRRNEYVAQMHERFRAEQNVARLQRDGHFELAFQPQLSLADGRLRGADGSLRGPAFIADYRTLGLMPELDFMVLGEAVDAARQLGGHGAFTLSVNLSPQTVVDARLDGVLERLLARPLPDGVTLEFEVTEHQSVADFAVFAAALERLRRRGHAVALDDFGSGYSTLAYLTRFPFDKIKLDRTLVLALSRPDGAAFMAATVRMCRVSGATVLVEGVETEAELSVVKGCGADAVQGYLTGRPQPLPALLERLQGS